jgi:DUF305 family protein family protein
MPVVGSATCAGPNCLERDFRIINRILIEDTTFGRHVSGNLTLRGTVRARRLMMLGGKMAWLSRSFVRKRVISLATTTSLAVASLVMAHGPTSAHRIHQTMPIQYVADWHDNSDEAPFLSENEAAMNKMMTDMRVKPSGDVDRDFVAMMVPHHQGAVDMAKAELAYGHNEALRRLAQEIVVNQDQEISAMRRAVGDKSPAGSPAQPAAGSSPSSMSQPMMGMSPDAMAH